MFNSYLDLVNDTILLFAILSAIHDVFDPTKFASQVAMTLLVSLIVPLLMSAVTIAHQRPLVIIDSCQWIHCKGAVVDKKKMVLVCRIIIVIFFPIVPAMILFASEKAKEKRNGLKTKDLRNDRVKQEEAIVRSELLTDFINECRLAMLTLKRNELSLELVLQLSIHLTMVLLSDTQFPLESGLQAVFQDADGTQEDGLIWSE